MALSNWDLLALNSQGQPCDGTLFIPDGSGIEIYKNKLHIHNPKLWKKSCGYSKPIIAVVQAGDLQLAGLQINAIRHDLQQSVFCYIEHRAYRGKGKKKYETHEDYRMCGIGSYGFKEEIEWLKERHPEIFASIPQEYLDKDMSVYSTREEWGFAWYGDNDIHEISMNVARPSLNDLWTGILPATVTAFFEWLKEVAAEDYFSTINQEKILRFNQGDAYFAEKLGIDLKPTPPGQSGPTVFGQLLGENNAES